ncbi:MAG: hypothetical protein ACFHVJ_13755 [Aestuariibacter sp.]
MEFEKFAMNKALYYPLSLIASEGIDAIPGEIKGQLQSYALRYIGMGSTSLKMVSDVQFLFSKSEMYEFIPQAIEINANRRELIFDREFVKDLYGFK